MIPVCFQCGTPDPGTGPCPQAPPFRSDHFTGTRVGCRHCGRLRETCILRPCPPRAERALRVRGLVLALLAEGRAARQPGAT
jgi:hypothetical protein